MNKTINLAVAIALGLAGPAALAADSGFYIGAGVGQTSASADTAGAIAITEFFGGTPTSVTTDDTDTTGRVFGGFNFNKHLGIELSYADLGDGKITVYDAVNNLTDTYKLSGTGFGLALTGRLPTSCLASPRSGRSCGSPKLPPMSILAGQ